MNLYVSTPVLPAKSGVARIRGRERIKQFWESRIKLGVRDHTFDIIETEADGKYAYQVTKNTVHLCATPVERLSRAATVRIFEKQNDGTWGNKNPHVQIAGRPLAEACARRCAPDGVAASAAAVTLPLSTQSFEWIVLGKVIGTPAQ